MYKNWVNFIFEFLAILSWEWGKSVENYCEGKTDFFFLIYGFQINVLLFFSNGASLRSKDFFSKLILILFEVPNYATAHLSIHYFSFFRALYHHHYHYYYSQYLFLCKKMIMKITHVSSKNKSKITISWDVWCDE